MGGRRIVVHFAWTLVFAALLTCIDVGPVNIPWRLLAD
jgi:hypothetical protein